MSGVALFRSSTFEKITITVAEVALNKINNNENKNERPEYHGISIPFKSSGLLKTGESHFSLVRVMELLVKEKIFPETLTCQT